MSKFIQGATALVLLLMLAAGCQPVPIPTSDVHPTQTVSPTSAPQKTRLPVLGTQTPEPTPSEGPVPEGGTITVGAIGSVSLEVNAMPPFLAAALYDSLLRPNPASGALDPGLAESYQVSSNGTTITFQLREDVHWHDGEPLTAADVAATMNALASPDFRGTPVTDFGTFIKATATDRRTIQVSLREPYCPAITYLGLLKILPRAVAESSNFPHLTFSQLVGTGPLKFVSRVEDQITFAPNHDYYLGSPHADTWVLKLYPDTIALRTAFTANQVDLMALGPSDYGALKGVTNASAFATSAPQLVTLLFNADTVTLNDPRVRQALAYALDRQVLLNDVAGLGDLVDASTLPNYWAAPQDLWKYPFSISQSKQLLAEAGWRQADDGILRKDRKAMTLELWTEADDPLLEPLAFRIREMYAALGIQVELQLDDRSGWITRVFQHRFDLLLTLRNLPLDPDQHWYWQSDQSAEGSGFNLGSYVSARVDGLLRQSLRVDGCNANARAELFGELNRNLEVDAPAVFLFAPKQLLVAREHVTGLAPSSFAGDFWNLNAWRVR